MSMAQTKESLIGLLRDDQVKVLALSGKWGTGKTEMLRQVREVSQDERTKNALPVSLFGVSSLAQMKLKLAQCALPLLKKKGPKADALRAAIGSLKTGLQGFFQINSAIDELALLAVPTMVRDKFIVLDDIERKHDDLAIDEILGFIDDFTQNYGCRIMLILNSDQLTDKLVWETFREKVIDEELRLETTPTEAFNIAIQRYPSTYVALIKPAIEACGLTNIRIVQKIIRTVNKILAQHPGLDSEILQRIVPSTVLMSAIYFKGIEEGPTMEFVLNFGSSLGRAVRQLNRDRRGGEPTEEEKLHARWALLLSRLGIASTDEYEALVARYLEAGLVDQSALDTVLDRYRREQQHAGARSRVHEYFDAIQWDPDLTPAQILARARGLLNDAPYLDCYTVTALHDQVRELDSGELLAEEMVSSWIARLNDLVAVPGANPEHFNPTNLMGRRLHPRIIEAYAEARQQFEHERTLLDVLLHLARNNSWGTDEESVMQGATIEDYMATILNSRGEDLKLFMLKSLDILANRGAYPMFGSAPDKFLEACKRIRDAHAGTAWATLIENQFRYAKLEALLDAGLSDAAA